MWYLKKMMSFQTAETRFELQMDSHYRKCLNSPSRAVPRYCKAVAATVMLANGAHTIAALYVAVTTVTDVVNSAAEFPSSANVRGK